MVLLGAGCGFVLGCLLSSVGWKIITDQRIQWLREKYGLVDDGGLPSAEEEIAT